MRLIFAFLALLAGAAAQAQTTSVPSAQQVRLLAPQLVNFSGSTANFESLVNGLTAGTPVTLTTIGADGTMQIVTFLPGQTLSVADAARILETARQNLIARGIATPSAQQVAAALMGGTVSNGMTSATLPGILTGSVNATTVQVRNEAFPVATPGFNTANALSPANIESLRASLPPVTAASLSGTDFNQALQLAIGLLAQQGIVNPTSEQLRVALVGGTLTTATGANITLQGLLQPRVRNTSESPFFGTSNSPLLGTSNTPATLNPVITPPPASTGGLVRPPTAAPAPNRLGARAGG
ncbi:MAG: hypothetical protein EPO20_04805 [Betaproteobacteria bacterium]|nr:MAG: hypothetical protein EPO20_04805 [Betaproteobacteria bacterium]